MGVIVKGMVFKNERETNGEVWYSYALSLSSKNMEGEWISTSVPIRFRKDIKLINRTVIEIIDGWPIVIQYKDGSKRLGFFANEFDVIEGGAVNKKPEGFEGVKNDDIPF